MRFGFPVALMLIAAPASTQQAPINEPSQAETTPAEAAPSPDDPLSVLRRQRDRLKEFGITFTLQEQSEVWGKFAGRRAAGDQLQRSDQRKARYRSRQGGGLVRRRVLRQRFDIHGHGPTQSLVGNQQIVSSIEATPSIKLFDLWLDQSLFDKRLSVRIGQEGADDELMITQYGGLFVNSSFGLPSMAAVNLPSGGPAYPLATPFARLKFQANDNLSLIGAVFNGDPAPPGAGDP